jgi:ribosome recycling factor
VPVILVFNKRDILSEEELHYEQMMRKLYEIVRLGIPQPTGERRKELVKQCNKIAEKAKVEVRNVRQEIKEKLKKAIKDGLSEDLEKDAENDLQKLHDKYIKQLEALMDDKEKEIMTV